MYFNEDIINSVYRKMLKITFCPEKKNIQVKLKVELPMEETSSLKTDSSS